MKKPKRIKISEHLRTAPKRGAGGRFTSGTKGGKSKGKSTSSKATGQMRLL